MLCDQLPTILAELKLPTEHRAQAALRRLPAGGRAHAHLDGPPHELAELKASLWKAVATPKFGLDCSRPCAEEIPFRMFGEPRAVRTLPDADDAYQQSAGPAADALFRVEVPYSRGGEISYHPSGSAHQSPWPGSERRPPLGRDRDLLNMLLMNSRRSGRARPDREVWTGVRECARPFG